MSEAFLEIRPFHVKEERRGNTCDALHKSMLREQKAFEKLTGLIAGTLFVHVHP